MEPLVRVARRWGAVLLERRSDNGRWGMPGGVQEIGENIAGTVVREPVGGEIKVSSESLAVRWVPGAELDSLDISPTTRRRLEEGFRNAEFPLIS